MKDGRPGALLEDEERRMLRVRCIVDGAAHRIMHGNCTREQVSEIVEQARVRVLELFPHQGHVFDLIYRPRLTRLYEDWG